MDVFKVREEGQGDQQVGLFGTGVTVTGVGDLYRRCRVQYLLASGAARSADTGVRDILIACIDNLTGLADVIQDMYPATDVQLCLVHQMRNSSKYITNKDPKPMMQDLKEDIPGYKY